MPRWSHWSRTSSARTALRWTASPACRPRWRSTRRSTTPPLLSCAARRGPDMSFILDALKKSENDRQRQASPALFEVKVAAPRRRFPLWAVGLAVLLGVNFIAVGWVLLRQPPAVENPASVAPAIATPLAAATSSPTAPP